MTLSGIPVRPRDAKLLSRALKRLKVRLPRAGTRRQSLQARLRPTGLCSLTDSLTHGRVCSHGSRCRCQAASSVTLESRVSLSKPLKARPNGRVAWFAMRRPSRSPLSRRCTPPCTGLLTSTWLHAQTLIVPAPNHAHASRIRIQCFVMVSVQSRRRPPCQTLTCRATSCRRTLASPLPRCSRYGPGRLHILHPLGTIHHRDRRGHRDHRNRQPYVPRHSASRRPPPSSQPRACSLCSSQLVNDE